MLFFIMFHDFRFGLSIFTTHLSSYALMSFPHEKITINELELFSGNSINVIFHVEMTFNECVCQICGKYAKTKSEIHKYYEKYNNLFLILNCRSWDFKTFVIKGKPNLD